MADMVSKNLSRILNIPEDEEIDGELEESESTELSVDPLTNQPTYSSSLVTKKDIEEFENVKSDLGIEEFAKIVLMKSAKKAMADHDELISIMAKVDDSKAARMAEVAQSALGNAMDSAKSLMQFELSKQRMELEKRKIEVKSVTLQQDNQFIINGSQKDVLDQIKAIMNNTDNAIDGLLGDDSDDDLNLPFKKS